MKKLFCIIAVSFAIVPPLLAQESEAPEGFSGSVSAIGRFDANPYSATPVKGGQFEKGFSFSNTSLYTTLDLQFTSWLSFSMENHWLHTGDGMPGNLYKNTFRSDETNWLDWAYLNFAVKEVFNVSVGKVVVPRANYELLESDFNQHLETMSSMWNNAQIYQYGLIFAVTPLEGLEFTAAATTSPFGEKFFKSGLYTYSVMGKYTTTGGFGIGASFSLWGQEKKSFIPLGSFTISYENDNILFYNDFETKAGDVEVETEKYLNDYKFVDGLTNNTFFRYKFDDRWSLTARFNYDRYYEQKWNRFKPALIGEFEVLKGLRIHALGCYQFGDMGHAIGFNAGVTYNFTYSF